MLKHLSGPDARPSRVVVIGRSGFLAQHLVADLATSGIPIEVLGRPEIDLTSPTSVDALSRVIRADDSVVMLSALTPDKGRDFRTLIKNLRMAEHLGDLCDRSRCAHFVYVSSDAVYDGKQLPLDEGSSREPGDLYALMHTSREMILQSVLAARQIPLCIVRPVALFGPGDTHNSYGPNRFVREAFEHRTITLFGKGEDERSHVYVQDATQLITRCLTQKSEGILNIASPETVSFMQVAEAVRAACPFPTSLVLKDRPGAGAISRRPFAAHQLHDAFPDFEFTPMSAGVRTLVLSYQQHATGALSRAQ
jgi:nucleoside-diphosphate-sugar epimerase